MESVFFLLRLKSSEVKKSPNINTLHNDNIKIKEKPGKFCVIYTPSSNINKLISAAALLKLESPGNILVTSSPISTKFL